MVIEISSNNAEVTSADTDTVMTGVQNTLTFTTPANWSTAQTVTVNAGEDDDAVNDAATIAHAVVDASSADEYDPVVNVDLASPSPTTTRRASPSPPPTPSPWGRAAAPPTPSS